MTYEHWQGIYQKHDPTRVGWHEPVPETSLRLVLTAVEQGARSAIDIGGGASSLVDHLLDRDLDRIAVVDISDAGLEVARRRLGVRATEVDWIVGDVTALEDVGSFDVWHDRAAFHFVLDPAARHRYVELATRTVPVGGRAIIATFALDGPESCSGLPVQRYGPDELARAFGMGWRLAGQERHLHLTPRGVEQRYLYSSLDRVEPG